MLLVSSLIEMSPILATNKYTVKRNIQI